MALPQNMNALRAEAAVRQATIENRIAKAHALVSVLLADPANPHFSAFVELYSVLRALDMDVRRALELVPEWLPGHPENP